MQLTLSQTRPDIMARAMVCSQLSLDNIFGLASRKFLAARTRIWVKIEVGQVAAMLSVDRLSIWFPLKSSLMSLFAEVICKWNVFRWFFQQVRIRVFSLFNWSTGEKN